MDAFYSGRVQRFVANRALRLIPPYWAAVVFSIAVHVVVVQTGTAKYPDYAETPDIMFTFENLLVQLTAIIPVVNVNNLLPNSEWYYFVRYAWAIFVEFAFYLAVAACMVAWHVAKRFISIALYVSGCALFFLALHVMNEFWRPLHGIFRFVPYFTLGIALYAVIARKSRVAGLFAGVSYVLVAIHFTRYTQGEIPAYADWWSGLAKPVVAVPVSIMLLIPVLLVVFAKLELSIQSTRVDKWLGDLSYPLYLNHYAVIVLVLSFSSSPSFALQMVAVSAAIVVSLLVKIAIETPMARLRDNIRGRPLMSDAA